MAKKYLYIAILFILSFGVYVNTIKNEFVYDDNDLILRNPQVKKSSVQEIFSTPFWGERKFGLWRPITILSFRLNYLMKGFSASLFHLTNIILHSLTVLILYFFLLHMTGKYEVSFVSSLIYAVHPVHTEAVAWIVGRSEILATLFSLLAFLFLIQFHKGKRRWEKITCFLLSGIFFLVSLLSKETGITLPFLYFLYLIIFQREKIKHLKTWTGLIYLLFLSLIYIYIRIKVLGGIIGPVGEAEYFYQYPPFTPFLTLPLLFFQYLKLSLFPFSLCVDYTFSPITHLSPLFFLLSIVFLLYIFLIFFTLTRHPLLSFSLSFFLLSLFPYLHIIPIGWLIGERFLYLPTVGICLLMGVGLEKMSFKGRYLLIFILIFSFSLRTYTRNFIWKNEFTLWKATAQDNPDSVRAYYNLANFYGRKGDILQAKKFYAQAHNNTKGRKKKHFADIYNNWGLLLGKEGKMKEAEILFRKALEINPFLATAYINLGNILISQGRLEEGIKLYKKSVLINPSEPRVYKNLSWAYLKKRDLGKSEEYALKFLNDFKDTPHSLRAEVLNYLATIYLLKNNIHQSEEYLKKSIEEDVSFPLSYLNYGNILMKSGENNKAKEMFLMALRYGGPKEVIYRNLGLLFYREKKLEESKKYWEKSLKVNPGNALPWYYLGLILEKQGNTQEAKRMWKKSLSCNPPQDIKKLIKEKLKMK